MTFVRCLLVAVAVAIALVCGPGAEALSAQAPRTVTGRVIDQDTRQPLADVHVGVLGTTAVTAGQQDGRFTVVVPEGAATLVVRRIGYRESEVAVAADVSRVEVELEADPLRLEEVVVTGRSTGVQRRNLANAVAKVDAAELVKAPTATVEQALQGKVAGASIRTNSGAPGGGVSVALRGVSSIIGANTPLYVVDGVIVSDVAVPPGVNAVTQAAPGNALTSPQENPVNRIADLNPNDIESVEVLKGPSAAAIYGSKAAGGVIVITTKRGQQGRTTFNVRQEVGVSSMARGVGFRRFETVDEAVAAFGPQAADYWRPGTFFDHEEALAGSNPASYQTALSASGGSENTRYFSSVLMRHEGGTIDGTFGDKQALRLNLDQVVGSRLTASLATQVVHTKSDRGLTQNDNSGTSYYGALTSTPSFFDLRPGADGLFPVNPFSASNPLQTAALLRNSESVWRVIGSGNVTAELIQAPRHALRFVGVAGLDHFTQNNYVLSPPELQFESNDGLAGTVGESYTQGLNVNVGGSLVHEFRPSERVTSTLSAGIQYETRDQDLTRALGQNLPTGLGNVNAGTVLTADQRRERVRDVGFYAQEEVLVDERLLLTAGVRADRSSNNADADKLWLYPKAAASYRLTLGDGWLNEVKLRSAYGQSGNQPEFGQRYTALLSGNVSGVQGFRIQGATAAVDLHPERQREIEVGADLTLLRSNALLELTGYEKKITDLLLQLPLPPSSGFISEFRNSGALRVRGLEASITGTAALGRFSWTPRLNFSLYRCTMLELPQAKVIPGGFGVGFGQRELVVGESCGQVVGNDSLADGSVVTRKIGDEIPDFTLGWSNALSYGDASLYFLWDWQKGGRMLNLTSWYNDFFMNSDDYLEGEGGELSGAERFALWPKQSALYFEDAGFLKLREVQLSYTLPESLRLWGAARSVTLSVTGRNLITVTPYRTGDPEGTQQAGSLAGFGRWDLWAYPPSRSFWFAVDIGF